MENEFTKIESYGQVFRQLREQAGPGRMGLSYQGLAERLDLRSVIIERIERGDRRALRNSDFYDELARQPNLFGLEGVTRLLQTADAPKFIDIRFNEPTYVSKVNIVTGEEDPNGIEMATYADTNRFSDEELVALKPQAMVPIEEYLKQLAEKLQNPQK